jgi:hypothetical protein
MWKWMNHLVATVVTVTEIQSSLYERPWRLGLLNSLYKKTWDHILFVARGLDSLIREPENSTPLKSKHILGLDIDLPQSISQSHKLILPWSNLMIFSIPWCSELLSKIFPHGTYIRISCFPSNVLSISPRWHWFGNTRYKKVMFLCLMNYALWYKETLRWRWVVSVTSWPIYPRGKNHRYPLDRRLGGPQSRSGRCEEEKNLAPIGNQTPAVQPVAIATEPSRLPRNTMYSV